MNSSTGRRDRGEIDYAGRARDALGFSRWWQIAAAVVTMMLVSVYQYGWSTIQGPLATEFGVPTSTLGLAFTLYVVFQAGSQFPVGWWRDRHGPRTITLLAGVLAGGGFAGLAYVTTPWQLYLLYSLGAVGVGVVYTVAINTALKWFPDLRGSTTGVGAMAFAGGSVLFVPYLGATLPHAGLSVLRNLGLLIAVGVVVGAVVLRDPPDGWLLDASSGGTADAEAVDPETVDSGTVDAASSDRGTDAGDPPVDADRDGRLDGEYERQRQYGWRDAVRTRQFWLLYAMFVCMSGAGLMVTANVVSFARDAGLTALVATISATVLPLSDGIGRPAIGSVSDRFGRERTMTAGFCLCGLGLFAIVALGGIGSSLGFVGAVIFATFFEGSQYTLFPSATGDYYGQERSSANYALLYTAKIWGGTIGGVVAGWLAVTVGWPAVFGIGGALAVLAGLGALRLHPPSQRG